MDVFLLVDKKEIPVILSEHLYEEEEQLKVKSIFM